MGTAPESTQAEIQFQNWYELETTFLRNRLYDGSVMEIKIGGGDWQDILASGGIFLSGGYDGTIDGCDIDLRSKVSEKPLVPRLGVSTPPRGGALGTELASASEHLTIHPVAKSKSCRDCFRMPGPCMHKHVFVQQQIELALRQARQRHIGLTGGGSRQSATIGSCARRNQQEHADANDLAHL